MKKPSILILTFAMIGCGEFEAEGDIEGVGDSAAVGDSASGGDSAADDTVEIQSALGQADRCVRVRQKSATLSWKGTVTAPCENRDHGNGASELYSANVGVWWSDVLGRAHEVHGAIWGAYLQMNAQFSALGYPTTDESNPRFGGGKYNAFQGGVILWKNAALYAFGVYGQIYLQYGNFSAEWGELGWPTNFEYTLGTRRKQDFEYGKINWTSSKGTWPTMTSTGNPSDRIDSALRPKISAMSLDPVTGTTARIRATAERLTPGATVTLRLTRPDQGTTTSGTATVNADGRVHFDFTGSIDRIWRTNGYVTFWAYQDAGNQAVAGKSANNTVSTAFQGQF